MSPSEKERAGGEKGLGEGSRRGQQTRQAHSLGQPCPGIGGAEVGCVTVAGCGSQHWPAPWARVSPFLPHAPSPAQVLSKQLAEK